MLRLEQSNVKKDGIHVVTGKTGKPIIYEWSEELRIALSCVLEARPVDISPYLFCNRYGQKYIKETGECSGFDSMWQRFMRRLINETKITEKFTEHDLRAKVASDADSLEHARALLTHADSKTTNKIYRRKAEKVLPMSYENRMKNTNE